MVGINYDLVGWQPQPPHDIEIPHKEPLKAPLGTIYKDTYGNQYLYARFINNAELPLRAPIKIQGTSAMPSPANVLPTDAYSSAVSSWNFFHGYTIRPVPISVGTDKTNTYYGLVLLERGENVSNWQPDFNPPLPVWVDEKRPREGYLFSFLDDFEPISNLIMTDMCGSQSSIIEADTTGVLCEAVWWLKLSASMSLPNEKVTQLFTMSSSDLNSTSFNSNPARDVDGNTIAVSIESSTDIDSVWLPRGEVTIIPSTSGEPLFYLPLFSVRRWMSGPPNIHPLLSFYVGATTLSSSTMTLPANTFFKVRLYLTKFQVYHSPIWS